MVAAISEEPKPEGTQISQDKLNVETDSDGPWCLPDSWRFWSIFVALCLLSFISALDVSIVTTALPTITKEIGGEEQYVWIANSFVLASSVPQPLFGQVSNIFGRRGPVIVAVLLFALGSGVAGGAHKPAMLIAGRSVQGVGAGGIYVLIDIICCDLVPLRERGKYLGYMFSFAGLGATIGPVIGGALALADWRWIFYLNLPVCGVALGVILPFLRLNHTRNPTMRKALARVDFLGNVIFMAAMISLLFGVVMGGVQYPWHSWRIVLPIVLGVLGWAAFHFHQASPICMEPSIPPRLFQNRTSATALLLTCISSIILQAITYFLPVYFQGVLGTSALSSGVKFLPFAITINFWAVLAGFLVSKLGKYRPLHWAGFGLSAIGNGSFSLLDGESSTAAWACFQVIAAAGSGCILSIMLPAIMAALPESDVAAASSAYSFTRTVGQIWGITFASIVFNAEFNRYSGDIADLHVRSQLANGAAYAYASEQFVPHLPEPTRSEVTGVYVKALRTIWYVGVGLSCLAFVLVFVEKEIPLRKDLDTKYGLEDKKSNRAPGSAAEEQAV